MELNGIEGNLLHISNVDIRDGIPLLDLKPYVPAFDRVQAERAGWLEEVGRRARQVGADTRFAE